MQAITTVVFPLSVGVMMMSSACFRLLMAFCSAGEKFVGGSLALAKHPVILVLANCATFDVMSLFTKVPADLAASVASERLKAVSSFSE